MKEPFKVTPEKKRVIEGLFECQYGSHLVRVWRAANRADDVLDRKFFDDVREQVKNAHRNDWSMTSLIERIAKMPGVNAVQIRIEGPLVNVADSHLETKGMVIYNDWP